MAVEQNPIYRKPIVPWYDSNTACVLYMVFMFFVILFGLCGAAVAFETQEYRSHGWIAALLTGLSGWIFLSVGFRLSRRRVRQKDGMI